ncbi:hypothetical protein OEZ49_17995 [Ruegeria sp. WL0004]|uniref:Uncharacterized protein n=1 Tax=Ruegeria marisflavi TaxID=2984152 RepID=A0ABT2WUT6_9RHOB|nr:hypothetical protein [Ruegeria sp. WL0004]MCU9839670.1 hypothetical protein [Ruegeria sp. WL0004]
MNSRQLRSAVLDHVQPIKLILAEEKAKPRPGSDAHWDNPHAQKPLRLNGSPVIVALIEVLCDQMAVNTGTRPQKTDVLNRLIVEGLAGLARTPDFAGLYPKPEWPEDTE